MLTQLLWNKPLRWKGVAATNAWRYSLWRIISIKSCNPKEIENLGNVLTTNCQNSWTSYSVKCESLPFGTSHLEECIKLKQTSGGAPTAHYLSKNSRIISKWKSPFLKIFFGNSTIPVEDFHTNTLYSTKLALCVGTEEYAQPVLSGYSHSSKFDPILCKLKVLRISSANYILNRFKIFSRNYLVPLYGCASIATVAKWIN